MPEAHAFLYKYMPISFWKLKQISAKEIIVTSGYWGKDILLDLKEGKIILIEVSNGNV